VGSQAFQEELLTQVSQQLGPNHFGHERRESAERNAARILSEEVASLGLSIEQLQLLPARSEAKLRVAWRLRQETTLNLRWIAQQLWVGSWKYLSNLLIEEQSDPQQPGLRLWYLDNVIALHSVATISGPRLVV